MRKVLLASTALFALGSVSAMAADITISGGFRNCIYDMGIQTQLMKHAFASETDWNVKFSNTTDSGITTSLNYGFDETGGVDERMNAISGDFGTIRLLTLLMVMMALLMRLDIEAEMADKAEEGSQTSAYFRLHGGWSSSYWW